MYTAQDNHKGAPDIMSEQLHITHRDAYLRGAAQGELDALAGRSYRPRDGATGTQDAQRAYRLGYGDGWTASWPCGNGTCDHPAHRTAAENETGWPAQHRPACVNRWPSESDRSEQERQD
jgi:hypothetical protein